MQYVLLTFNAPDALDDWKALTATERRAEEDEYVRLVEALRESDAYVAANEFEPSTPVRTVRVRNGTTSVMDGPAVESEESLTGYFLIDVDSEEADGRYSGRRAHVARSRAGVRSRRAAPSRSSSAAPRRRFGGC